MFLFRTIFLVTAIWSNVVAHEDMRLCPACIDDNYSVFFDNNAVIFRKSLRNYGRREGLEKYRCEENSHKLVQCDNSCVSIHLKVTEQKRTRTIGWMFDCGTNVVKRVPSTVPNVPRDLRNFNGDLSYVDHLNTKDDLQIYFEVQFYNISSDVETVEQYHRRQDKERKEREEYEKFRKSPPTCFIQKVLNRKNVVFGLIAFIVVFAFALLIRSIGCYKKPEFKKDRELAELVPKHREQMEIVQETWV